MSAEATPLVPGMGGKQHARPPTKIFDTEN
jgi:hypothetical protein